MSRRCLYYACGRHREGSRSKWWRDWGTCSRAHAVLHYGEDVMEAQES